MFPWRSGLDMPWMDLFKLASLGLFVHLVFPKKKKKKKGKSGGISGAS
jgi:hypothetical protein